MRSIAVLPAVLGLVLALPVLAQTAKPPAAADAKPAAAAKPAAKPAGAKPAAKAPLARSAQKAVEEVTPIDDDPSIRLTDADLEVAKQVFVGTMPCELGASVQVRPARRAGLFVVTTKGFRFLMHPVESRTGAIRLEDGKRGAMWLQLGNKSMLMSQKLGQRLADECQSPQQVTFAEELKKNPRPSILEPMPHGGGMPGGPMQGGPMQGGMPGGHMPGGHMQGGHMQGGQMQGGQMQGGQMQGGMPAPAPGATPSADPAAPGAAAAPAAPASAPTHTNH